MVSFVVAINRVDVGDLIVDLVDVDRNNVDLDVDLVEVDLVDVDLVDIGLVTITRQECFRLLSFEKCCTTN